MTNSPAVTDFPANYSVGTPPLVRVVGSNYTVFTWNGKLIAFLEVVQDSGQQAFGGQGGYDVIHPLGYAYPAEVVTSRVVSAGQMTLTIRETWNENVWEQMYGLAGTTDIIDVFTTMAAMQSPVSCATYIHKPNGQVRGSVYHNCVITNIQDGETIEIGALSVPKTVTIVYTNKTRYPAPAKKKTTTRRSA